MQKLISLISLIVVTNLAMAQDSPGRFALVMGVRDYIHVQPLKNSLNDAQDMAATLKARGFKVVESYNPRSKREMQDAIRTYYDLVSQSKGATGLIFYSGHGMQVDGSNYLVPAEANPQLKADLDDQTVKMDFLMQVIEEAGLSLSIVIMDACRNNPFRGFSRSGEKGLNQVVAPRGSYIVYATAPGSVASDGTGRNGLFTSKLLKYINTPGVALEQVFKSVGRDVQNESGGSQVPWINTSYTGDFYFAEEGSGSSIAAYNAIEFYSGDKLTGAVSINYVFAQLPEVKAIDIEMTRMVNELTESYKAMANDFEKKLAAYNALPSTTSQADKKSKEDELTGLQSKMQAFDRDSQTTLSIRQKKLLEPVWDRFDDVCISINEEKNYRHVSNEKCTTRPDPSLTSLFLEKFNSSKGRR